MLLAASSEDKTRSSIEGVFSPLLRQHLAQVGWRGPVTVSAFSLPDEDGEACFRIERA
jgi:hypothetical protein